MLATALRKQIPMLYAAGGLLLGGLSVATAALAAEPVESFPSRPVHIILPFTPGGGTDVIARKLAPGMQQRLGQSVVIDNRPGGNARIGANLVAKSEPDGYNLLLTTSGAFVIAPFIGGRPPYDSLKDFAPITVIARSPILMVAGPKAPIASIADLVAFAKRAPGKVTYASSGVGGPPHLAAEMLKQAAGFDMLMIPYSGTGDVNVALLRGDVDIAVGALAAVLPLLQQKDVKALAVTSAKRSFALPNVPSIGETVPGFTDPWKSAPTVLLIHGFADARSVARLGPASRARIPGAAHRPPRLRQIGPDAGGFRLVARSYGGRHRIVHRGPCGCGRACDRLQDRDAAEHSAGGKAA